MPRLAPEQVAAEIRHRRAIFGGGPRRRRLPRQLPPTGVIAGYYVALRSILERGRALVDARLLPALPRMVEQAALQRRDAARADRDDVNRLMDAISEQYFKDLRPEDLDRRARAVAEQTTGWQRDQFRKQTRAAFGVDLLAAEPNLAGRIDDFAAENVALIKTVPNTYFDQIEGVVTRGLRQGTRHEDLAKEMEERFGVARDRAKLIARDQVLTLLADVNRARQEAIGVKRYVWRTVSDSRVRPEHEERDGQTFEWDDPPEDGAPGEAILCRCWAEPDFSDILGNL